VSCSTHTNVICCNDYSCRKVGLVLLHVLVVPVRYVAIDFLKFFSAFDRDILQHFYNLLLVLLGLPITVVAKVARRLLHASK
jgi:hypothetical protein